MKKIFTLSLSLTFLLMLSGTTADVFATVEDGSTMSDNSDNTQMTDKMHKKQKVKMKKTVRNTVKQGKKIAKKVKKEMRKNHRKDRFLSRCIENDMTEEECAKKGQQAREDIRKLRKVKRKAFVSMIIQSKLSCINKIGKENRDEVRKCFRESVKAGIIEGIMKKREYRAECREDKNNIGITLRACIAKKEAGNDEDDETGDEMVESDAEESESDDEEMNEDSENDNEGESEEDTDNEDDVEGTDDDTDGSDDDANDIDDDSADTNDSDSSDDTDSNDENTDDDSSDEDSADSSDDTTGN